MDHKQLIYVSDAIETISEHMGVAIPDIVKALKGVCFDGKEAREIIAYHQDESDI